MMRSIVATILVCWFGSIAFAQTMPARTLPVWFWGETTQLLMQDGNGNRKAIAEIPWNQNFIMNESQMTYSSITGLNLAQHGSEIHIIVSNAWSVYYAYSPDNGATWETTEMDNLRNHTLYSHDPTTWAQTGVVEDKSKYLGLNNSLDIVVDRNGDPHMVWEVDGANIYYDTHVTYAVKREGKWIRKRVQTASGFPQGGVFYIALDVDDKLVPHVAINSYGRALDGSDASLRLLTPAAADGWQDQMISNEQAPLPSLEFRIDGKGVYHVVATVRDEQHEYAAKHWQSVDKGRHWTSKLINYGNCRYDLETDGQGGVYIAGTCYDDGVYYGEWTGGRWKLTELENRGQLCHTKVFISPQGEPGAAFLQDYGSSSNLVWYRPSGGGWESKEVLFAQGGRSSSIQPAVAFIRDEQANGVIPTVPVEPSKGNR